jgi:O-antigen ligase
LSWFSLFASQARTAFIAIILGILLSLIIMSLFQPRTLRNAFAPVMRNKRAFTGLMLSVIVALAVTVINWSNIQEGFSDFLAKGVESSSVREGFERSRGNAIEKSWKNFQENPVFGIGFGTASDPEDNKGLGGNIGGIAFSAPVEKGFLPSATLEENGLIGTFFLLVFMGMLLRGCLKKKNFTGLCIFLTCIFVNIGEMIFFSMGGIGLYIWLMIGLSLMDDPVTYNISLRSRFLQ